MGTMGDLCRYKVKRMDDIEHGTAQQRVDYGNGCSSFSSINVGTSRRSILLPEGRTDLAYISRGNCMMSRTACVE